MHSSIPQPFSLALAPHTPQAPKPNCSSTDSPALSLLAMLLLSEKLRG